MSMKFIFVTALALTFAGQAHADAEPVLPKMRLIPAGIITTLSCPAGMPLCPEHLYQRREISLPAFEIAETEVTFSEWDACVQDGACRSELSDWAYLNRPVLAPCQANQACHYPDDQSWGRKSRPVIHVSWSDVQQYLKWLNQKTAGNYRLPSSEEWEYAALAGSKTKFYWGDEAGKNNANCDACGGKWGGKQSAPVRSFKPNQFGLYDMVGNVSEWVSNCFPTRVAKNEVSATCMTYLIRGSAWSTLAKMADPRSFTSAYPDLRDSAVGFRIARSLKP